MRAVSRLDPDPLAVGPVTREAEDRAVRKTIAEVWGLAGPAIAHMMLVTLVFVVDRILLGHYGKDALASLQLSSILVWSLYSVLTAFSAGTLAVVGRSIGAGDRITAARAALGALAFAGVLGAIVAVPLVLAAGAVLSTLFPAVEAGVAANAEAYLAIVGLTLPFAFVEAIAAAALQASGDTRTPLFAASLGNALNLGLALLLVFGLGGFPELGVRGAAIATALATALQSMVLVAVLFGHRSPLPLRAALATRSVRGPLRRVLDVSGPAFAEKIVYQGSYLGFVAMIGSLGAAAMAANQALVSVEAICFLSADGFGIAAAALVAQKLGADRPTEASRSILVAAGMAMALLTSCGLVFVVAPRALVGAFSDDPSIVEAGSMALYATAVAQPFMAFAMVVRMGLRGAGATRAVLALTLAGSLLVRLPATWLLAVHLDLGLVGVWIGSTLDWVVQAALCAVLFLRGNWRKIRI